MTKEEIVQALRKMSWTCANDKLVLDAAAELIETYFRMFEDEVRKAKIVDMRVKQFDANKFVEETINIMESDAYKAYLKKAKEYIF